MYNFIDNLRTVSHTMCLPCVYHRI